MKQHGEVKVWSIEVLLDETSSETQAEVVLDLGDTRYAGWGRARRNPVDPDIPRVGEELAAARALSDLAHKLLDGAAEAIEGYQGAPARPHP